MHSANELLFRRSEWRLCWLWVSVQVFVQIFVSAKGFTVCCSSAKTTRRKVRTIRNRTSASTVAVSIVYFNLPFLTVAETGTLNHAHDSIS